MVLVAVRRRIVAMAALMLVGSACAPTSTSESESRAGSVYESIVRWLAQEVVGDPEPLPVFVEPRGEGASIELEVQTALISSTDDVATVRFIDSRDEAMITNDAGVAVVADDGVLIRLEPVSEEGSTVHIDVDIHRRDEQFRVLRFDLRLVGDRWIVDQPPVEQLNP